MRSIKEIEADLTIATQAVRALETERDAARLDRRGTEEGVPAGAKPIFAHKRKGEKVLVLGWKSMWPIGVVLKKDGTPGVAERTLYDREYTLVAE